MNLLGKLEEFSRALRWILSALLFSAGCQNKVEISKEPPSLVSPQREPTLRLLVFTNLRGELEPCGCNEHSLGGMDRLVHAVRKAESPGVPSLVLSAGDTFFGASSADDPAGRARTVAQVLALLPLAAAAPGSSDLAQGVTRLSELSKRAGAALLAAGVLSVATGPGQGPRSAEAFESARTARLAAGMSVMRAGLKVGVVGWVGARTASVAAMVSTQAMKQAGDRARKLRREGAELVLGLVSGNVSQANELAVLGDLDLVVLGDGTHAKSELSLRPVLRAGEKSERLLVVDLWLDTAKARFRSWEKSEPPPVVERQNWVRWKTVDLGRKSAQDPKSREVLQRYAQQVNEANQQEFAAAAPRPATAQTGGYVGSRPCASCHTAAYLWWTRTPHGNAYKSLTEVDKEYHLDCVGCHVTGYDQPGGSTVTHVEGLMNVGCESCHGPGSAHVADARPPLRFLHKEVSEGICRACHTREHSEAFDFKAYRDRLLVPGHGLPM